MAAFVNYSVGRTSMLGYNENFNHNISSDPLFIKTINILNDLVNRIQSSPIDFNQLEIALKQEDSAKFNSLLGFGHGDFESRMLAVGFAINILATKYPKGERGKMISKNIGKDEVVSNTISAIRSLKDFGSYKNHEKPKENKYINCPPGWGPGYEVYEVRDVCGLGAGLLGCGIGVALIDLATAGLSSLLLGGALLACAAGVFKDNISTEKVWVNCQNGGGEVYMGRKLTCFGYYTELLPNNPVVSKSVSIGPDDIYRR